MFNPRTPADGAPEAGPAGGDPQHQLRIVRDAVAGDQAAITVLVDWLTPVVQARVARTLLRRGAAGAGDDLRQKVADLTQESSWGCSPTGRRCCAPGSRTGASRCATSSALSLAGRCGESCAAPGRRPGRNRPSTPMTPAWWSMASRDPESRIASRQMLHLLLDRLEASLSPKGLELFRRLFVHQQTVETICADIGMSAEAVYAWRSRISRLARTLADQLRTQAMSNPARVEPTPLQDVGR